MSIIVVQGTLNSTHFEAKLGSLTGYEDFCSHRLESTFNSKLYGFQRVEFLELQFADLTIAKILDIKVILQ